MGMFSRLQGLVQSSKGFLEGGDLSSGLVEECCGLGLLLGERIQRVLQICELIGEVEVALLFG
jgi:hypothetical protein